ncbi:hypothetical protein EPN15_00535 [Patescibacteria group bacterium]|nr:MAG: hypothetical protein EPN15_00535 [Patescibacteria group bacterium]
MNERNASGIVRINKNISPLEILDLCDGYYSCPKDENGKRLGPMVGYAGRYETPDGKKQWVGDIYANFSKAEEYPHVLKYFADQMREKLLPMLDEIDVFCGAPIGGYAFSLMLGLACDRRVIKAEKKVIKTATAYEREKTNLVFGRHEVRECERVAIVEDVCNNFATTDQLIDLIEEAEGRAIAIICLLNRSLTIDHWYISKYNAGIPVISLVRMPIPEYKQDDPVVARDIAAGNVIWKPKDEWDRLKNNGTK